MMQDHRFDDRPFERAWTGAQRSHGALAQMAKLQHQAFGQISRTDAGWVERLDVMQDGLGFRFTEIRPADDFGHRCPEITVIVEIADQQPPDCLMAF